MNIETEPTPMFVHHAEATKLAAEADKLAAETRKANAEAREAEIKADKAAIDLEREQAKRSNELVADEYHFVYNFAGEVSASSVDNCRKQLQRWERQAGYEQITVTLRINSPGGSIFDGFDLIDHIEGMIYRGHEINTHAYGMAASMGGVLLQVGKTRRMGRSAAVLIHEASFRAGGKTGDVEDEIVLVHMLQDRILDIYVDRAKLSGASHPMTRRQIKSKWARRDWWISAADCLRFGFIDEIA